MRVSELTDALLDYWTARAEGVPAAELELRANGTLCVRNMPVVGLALGAVHVLDYCTNWSLTGPLVEKWADHPMVQGTNWNVVVCCGDPLTAICRAVVRAAFGDEVEDLP